MVKYSKRDVDLLQHNIENQKDAAIMLLTHSMDQYIGNLHIGCPECGCEDKKAANNINMQLTEITCPKCESSTLLLTIPVNLN